MLEIGAIGGLGLVLCILGVDRGVNILMNLSKVVSASVNRMVSSSPLTGLSSGSPGCSSRPLSSWVVPVMGTSGHCCSSIPFMSVCLVGGVPPTMSGSPS